MNVFIFSGNTFLTAFRSKPLMRWSGLLQDSYSCCLLGTSVAFISSITGSLTIQDVTRNALARMQVEQPRTSLQYVVAMSGLGSYWWPQICTLSKHSLGRVDAEFIPKTEHRRVILEARMHVLAYAIVLCASLILSSYFAVIFWVVPAMFGMVGLRMFLLAEHAGCENSKNMLLNTRTTLTNSIIKLIAWNMPYHCEHHLLLPKASRPAVPFHQLPQLHNHVKDRLASVSPGYLNFHVDYLPPRIVDDDGVGGAQVEARATWRSPQPQAASSLTQLQERVENRDAGCGQAPRRDGVTAPSSIAVLMRRLKASAQRSPICVF